MKKLTLLFFRLLIILLFIGFVYQYSSTKIDDAKYPPMGEMIDIGGYKLHLYKTGIDIGPTIVLDMGMGGNMLYWSLVQPEIAKIARVISYDRAGMGWSEESPKERSSENIVEELHTLLHKANLPAPYILVSHSFSGINARIFENKYPNEVAGIVLVDSSNEDQFARLPKQTDWISRLLNYRPGHPLLLAFTEFGVARIYNHITAGDELPQHLEDMLVAKNSTIKFVRTMIEEYSLFQSNLAYLKNTYPKPIDKPMIVITAGIKPHEKVCADRGLDIGVCGGAYDTWQILQKELLTKSTKSKQVIAEHSGHNAPLDAPEVIVKAVQDMLSGNI